LLDTKIVGLTPSGCAVLSCDLIQEWNHWSVYGFRKVA